MIEEQPTIYNAPGIYNMGSSGGGGGGGDLPEGYYDGYVNISGKYYPYVRFDYDSYRYLDIMAKNLDYIDDNISQSLSMIDIWDEVPRSFYFRNNPSLFGPNGYDFGRMYNARALNYLRINAPSIFSDAYNDGWRFLEETCHFLSNRYSTESYKLKDLLTWKLDSGSTTPDNLTKLNIEAAGLAEWFYPNTNAPVFSGLGESVIIDSYHSFGGEHGVWIKLNYNNDNVSMTDGQSGNKVMRYTRLARFVYK